MAFDANSYIHDSDKAALKALKAIPGFHQFVKMFMKVWSERQYKITNMSSCIRISEKQMPEYYDLLPPICDKLGIDVPELYLELDVTPNSYTSGDTKPFIVITSGLFETLPNELIPTVLAHECGHIACRHMLYTTMGNILLNSASSMLQRYVPFGDIASIPLEVAFFHWMRCSELSADRAAILCDGSAEKTVELCMRFAGYDKDIPVIADKEIFMVQAREYKDMISDSKWNRTLEFLTLYGRTHPLTAVRALEAQEWANTEQFHAIMNGTYQITEQEANPSESTELSESLVQDEKESSKEKKKLSFPGFKKRSNESNKVQDESSIFDEIRRYKELLDEGIITEEEFAIKKKQLLGL